MSISDIFTTPGIGGIIVAAVMSTAAVIYVSLTYWILRPDQEEQAPWDEMGWPFK